MGHTTSGPLEFASLLTNVISALGFRGTVPSGSPLSLTVSLAPHSPLQAFSDSWFQLLSLGQGFPNLPPPVPWSAFSLVCSAVFRSIHLDVSLGCHLKLNMSKRNSSSFHTPSLKHHSFQIVCCSPNIIDFFIPTLELHN